MSTEFEDAVQRVTQAVMFENWLRFYFIGEEDDALVIRLPEQAMGQIQKRYPDFHDLADRLNNREVDHQTSMAEVCLFVAGDFSARRLPEDLATRVFDSAAFMVEMQMFGSWVQAHEEQLDQGFIDFDGWRKLYGEWRQSDEVRDYARKLTAQAPTYADNSPDTTQ